MLYSWNCVIPNFISSVIFCFVATQVMPLCPFYCTGNWQNKGNTWLNEGYKVYWKPMVLPHKKFQTLVESCVQNLKTCITTLRGLSFLKGRIWVFYEPAFWRGRHTPQRGWGRDLLFLLSSRNLQKSNHSISAQHRQIKCFFTQISVSGYYFTMLSKEVKHNRIKLQQLV
jgi:hypothetical protein